ncbi:3-methyl-2-oxobutanoate hydroxymethyltransferase [Saccharospirillum salsuginis]|uniref:3-methyl-2-oxobutanoate hydroxymethyltransferase n=1 Tax=Saccharospirillum salsuginis TaxID=418750 RepID=A0A918K4F3_9GAMM|nr:3-methyl-2-oxobutanoate hydroxymethyltransferase [Saccharospirillum salsuginis]GGX45662.1 3-methyl-2-oxobutanoate hydroxymethyltransferase [Saccharospirillum salsuginis]
MANTKTVATIQKQVAEGKKFTVLTAYDASFAHCFSKLGVDVLLVGDSLGNVIQGQDTTLPVTMDDMVYHTAAVTRGNQGALIMADLPFNSYANLDQCQENSGRLMRAGAHMVKLEGGAWLCDSVIALGRAGIPTCVHLGLTPQSVNKFGGFKVQGRDQDAAQQMINDAMALSDAGADILLLECVPSDLARAITEAVHVPVIGIGAGPSTDGQVLVSYDMLGFNQNRLPKFVKNYMAEPNTLENAVTAFIDDVQSGAFPAAEHCFD